MAVTAIAVAAVVVPVPLLVVSPGEAISVSSHVDIEDPPSDITGDVLLTTVALRQTSAVGARAAGFEVETARDAGGDVFLVDDREADEARAAAGDDIAVIEVSTLEEAIAALAGEPG